MAHFLHLHTLMYLLLFAFTRSLFVQPLSWAVSWDFNELVFANITITLKTELLLKSFSKVNQKSPYFYLENFFISFSKWCVTTSRGFVHCLVNRFVSEMNWSEVFFSSFYAVQHITVLTLFMLFSLSIESGFGNDVTPE